MYSNKLYTPLRYPGGKGRFAPYVAEIMRANDLSGGHYLEPYAGGAGVALILLFDGIASDVHINDADPAIRDFWIAATRHTSTLIQMVESEPVTMEAWHHWRSVLFGSTETDLVGRGFATLFMNRTNRSGILKAGVIGGKAQAGEYKLDARYMRDALAARIAKIGEYSKHIHVYGEDALALLARCADFLPERSLIYLDPPYYIKGQGLYRNFYEHDDHLAIARQLQSPNFPRPWIVSYDDAPEIRAMYAPSQGMGYGLRYTAHSRYIGSEVMFFGDKLKNVPTNLPVAA
ncbi:D12 class N6 adenine-specific DNA methyltransferase [compost metagenome]